MKKNVLLAFVAILVSLVAGEILFRLNGKYATRSETNGIGGYDSRYKPTRNSWYCVYNENKSGGYKGDEFSVAWRSNSEGLNGADYSPQKKIGSFRIMMLGDSFTEGIGSSNDSSYPQQLSNILNDSLNLKTEVLNCGISGSDLVFEYRLFNDRLLKYKPDLVVLTVNSTDVEDVIIRGGFERFNKDGTVSYNIPPWFEPVYVKSFFVRRLVHDVFKYDWNFVAPKDLNAVEKESVSKLASAIDSFNMACTTNNIKLMLVFHPLDNELKGWAEKKTEALLAYCSKLNLPIVDASVYFKSKGIDSAESVKIYWPKDRHFNNVGYSYLAQSVWPTVATTIKCDGEY